MGLQQVRRGPLVRRKGTEAEESGGVEVGEVHVKGTG